MAFLNENEWILLNEIAYNISFIYTVEEMQKEILTRWLPFLISFDGAIFSRLQWDREGNYAFYEPVMDRISPETQHIWVEESTQSDQFRWIMYASKGITFRESISDPESTLKESKLYTAFYQPNHFGHSLGHPPPVPPGGKAPLSGAGHVCSGSTSQALCLPPRV